MIGIYCITNKINGKKYIGQSWNIKSRITKHKKKLKENNHENKHLQSAYNKYGKNNFEYKIILSINKSNVSQILLDNLEIFYITNLNLLNNQFGYNKRNGGSHGKMSEESKQKMSISGKKKKINWYCISKMKEAKKGAIVSLETRNKISFALKGKPKSKKHKLALSKLKLSKESIAKRTKTRSELGHFKWSAESIAKRELTKKLKRKLNETAGNHKRRN